MSKKISNSKAKNNLPSNHDKSKDSSAVTSKMLDEITSEFDNFLDDVFNEQYTELKRKNSKSSIKDNFAACSTEKSVKTKHTPMKGGNSKKSDFIAPDTSSVKQNPHTKSSVIKSQKASSSNTKISKNSEEKSTIEADPESNRTSIHALLSPNLVKQRNENINDDYIKSNQPTSHKIQDKPIKKVSCSQNPTEKLSSKQNEVNQLLTELSDIFNEGVDIFESGSKIESDNKISHGIRSSNEHRTTTNYQNNSLKVENRQNLKDVTDTPASQKRLAFQNSRSQSSDEIIYADDETIQYLLPKREPLKANTKATIDVFPRPLTDTKPLMPSDFKKNKKTSRKCADSSKSITDHPKYSNLTKNNTIQNQNSERIKNKNVMKPEALRYPEVEPSLPLYFVKDNTENSVDIEKPSCKNISVVKTIKQPVQTTDNTTCQSNASSNKDASDNSDEETPSVADLIKRYGSSDQKHDNQVQKVAIAKGIKSPSPRVMRKLAMFENSDENNSENVKKN